MADTCICFVNDMPKQWLKGSPKMLTFTKLIALATGFGVAR